MKKDIILAGVGGQGILSIAATIGMAAVRKGLYMKQAEVHGMSQRGGDVQSNLRLSDEPIASDLIPRGGVDLILSVEPMEALRYLPMLSPNGWLITNTAPHINIPNYPDLEALKEEIAHQPRHVMLDADQIARDMEARRSANIIMLGAASPFLCLEPQELEASIAQIFQRKGQEVVDQNIAAFRKGREIALEQEGMQDI
ncbi:MAG TPA: indolepyruvate oxidoreductase subunit beta [Bacteroidales bacterium]|nr:indolepyruvate oxidoreductase subunit beta [Bacteroidales bacterium]HRZ77531.1 indolepyruvate oxidoreductase subunit beta [Bacteroidales bacterium]